MVVETKGIILLELLVTLLLLEVGILGISGLFINASQACFDLQTSLRALELLRGELEKLEKRDYLTLTPYSLEVAEGITYTLQVDHKDPDGDGIIEYKLLKGQVTWRDYGGRERCYHLVYCRHNS